MGTPRRQSSSAPTVQLLGAVRAVTGSMHLVRFAGRKILLDCGLYLGGQAAPRSRNRQFPFSPAEIDAVLLSHAHIDHCGNLPNLVQQGFRGPIYCTPATRDLLGVMLADSARVQEKEAATYGRTPHYGRPQVARVVDQCQAVPYNQSADLGDGVQFELLDAGHVLGSALVHLRMATDARDYTMTYTGDLGRSGMPFLHPPSAVPPSDLLLSESTYGGKYHPSRQKMAERMAEVIKRTMQDGGKVLIPAFSLGRTQIVVHYLQKWTHEGILPRLPIFVDSPLVEDIMEVYRRHPECVAKDSLSMLEENTDAAVHYVHSFDESRDIVERKKPCVVVASGGMLDGGRAIYHLQKYIDDPRSSIVLVSFQAPGSLGRRLLERGPKISFLGRTWNKWADVVEIRGFSGHADHDDFLQAFVPLAGQTKKVCLVHGEEPSSFALAEALEGAGFEKVIVPHQDEVISVP